jgi:hypothetical protein
VPSGMRNHYSLFKVNGEPVYLESVNIFRASLLEGILELVEQLDSSVSLNTLQGDEKLELVMIPGNKHPSNYSMGVPVLLMELLSLQVKEVRGADHRYDYAYVVCTFYSTIEFP